MKDFCVYHLRSFFSGLVGAHSEFYVDLFVYVRKSPFFVSHVPIYTFVQLVEFTRISKLPIALQPLSVLNSPFPDFNPDIKISANFSNFFMFCLPQASPPQKTAVLNECHQLIQWSPIQQLLKNSAFIYTNVQKEQLYHRKHAVKFLFYSHMGGVVVKLKLGN